MATRWLSPPMWKRLLVPHDFSECARRALDVAVELATGRGAEVLLFHVSPLPPNLPPDAKILSSGAGEPVRVDDFVTGGARRALDAIAGPLQARGLVVRTLARAGEPRDPSRGILRVAEEEGVDVIVIGTHGRKGLAHLLLGSVAEKVIREANVPVVTVRTSAPEPTPTREESIAEDELAG